MRNKLKNYYFSKLARNVNIDKEARKIEEEFRLCKSYTITKHSDIKQISSEKLTDFFKDHLKEKPIEIQPEVINTERYPHFLSPNNININSDIPTISEVQDVRKKIKNGKCQGTDKIHAEEVKYNTSNRFMVYLMLLLTNIWTTFMIPSSCLISSITCLFKNKGLRRDAANYRGLSIMSTCSKILIATIISRI